MDGSCARCRAGYLCRDRRDGADLEPDRDFPRYPRTRGLHRLDHATDHLGWCGRNGFHGGAHGDQQRFVRLLEHRVVYHRIRIQCRKPRRGTALRCSRGVGAQPAYYGECPVNVAVVCAVPHRRNDGPACIRRRGVRVTSSVGRGIYRRISRSVSLRLHRKPMDNAVGGAVSRHGPGRSDEVVRA